ncbi:DUF6156 family protein [Methylomonas sp. AM2-LC]|uniref:DUF6156 family protein n=1 Tax=Methylomonas sp. AM2-LC TaxID=3153301 RepID=UPI003266FAFE
MNTSIENCKCRYFTSYSGVKLPLKLVNQLTDMVPENRNTYFRAYFDPEEQLILCQKLVYGEIELQHRYTYYSNHMLSQAEITDADGEVTVLSFTETGESLAD